MAFNSILQFIFIESFVAPDQQNAKTFVCATQILIQLPMIPRVPRGRAIRLNGRSLAKRPAARGHRKPGILMTRVSFVFKLDLIIIPFTKYNPQIAYLLPRRWADNYPGQAIELIRWLQPQCLLIRQTPFP